MMNSRGQRNLQAMGSRQDGNQQKDQRELKRTKSWPLNQDNGVLDLAPPPEENEEPNSSYFSRRTTSSDCGLGASDINPFNTAGKGRALFTNGAVGSNNDTTLHRNVNNNSGSVAPLPPPVATTITMTSSGTNNSNSSNNNSSNNINNNNRYSLSHLLTHSPNHLLTHLVSPQLLELLITVTQSELITTHKMLCETAPVQQLVAAAVARLSPLLVVATDK